MRKYRWRVAAGVAASALVLALANGPEPSTDPTYGKCVEDMPCWDCSTMGNLVCGSVPAGAVSN